MTQLDNEIDQMRGDLTTVANQLTDVRNQVAAGDTAAAEKLAPLADQLHAMAAGNSGGTTPPAATDPNQPTA